MNSKGKALKKVGKNNRYISFNNGRGRVKTAESEHLERNPILNPKK